MKVKYHIKEVMEARGLTMKETDRRAGMSRVALQGKVYRNQGISLEGIARIADAMEVPWTVLADITDDDGNPMPSQRWTMMGGLGLLPNYDTWAASDDGKRLIGNFVRDYGGGRRHVKVETDGE